MVAQMQEYMTQASWDAFGKRPEDFRNLLALLAMAADLAQNLWLETLAVQLFYMQGDVRIEIDGPLQPPS